MKYTVLAGALSLFSISAVANETVGLSFDYVEAGYAKTDVDGYDSPSYGGYIINLSKQFVGNWYFAGSYSQSSGDYSNVAKNLSSPLPDGTYSSDVIDTYSSVIDMELTRYSLGFGYIQHFSDVTSFDYVLSYGQSKFKSDTTVLYEREYAGDIFDSSKSRYNSSDTSDVFSVNARVRHLLTEQFEVNAGLGYERLHDEESENNLVLQAGLNYAITQRINLAASYRYVDEYADIAATLRYYF